MSCDLVDGKAYPDVCPSGIGGQQKSQLGTYVKAEICSGEVWVFGFGHVLDLSFISCRCPKCFNEHFHPYLQFHALRLFDLGVRPLEFPLQLEVADGIAIVWTNLPA